MTPRELRDDLVSSANAGLRRGFLLLTVGQIIFVVAGYVTHISLARGLGAAEYGTYGVLLSVLSTVALVLTAGMPEAIAKFAAERPESAHPIFAQGIGIQLRFSLVLALGYALCSPLIARGLGAPELTGVLAVSALAIPPVALYAVVLGALNGEKRFMAQGVTVSGYGLLRCLLVIPLTLHFKALGAVAAFVIAPAVVILPTLPGYWRTRAESTLDSRALWSFARPVIGFTVALQLLMNLDLFVVKAAFGDTDAVGYYTAATTLAKVPYFFFSALGVVLLPIVSAAGNEGRDHVLEVVRKAVRLMFLGASSAAAIAVPFSRGALSLLFGRAYAAAAWPLALLLVSGTLFTLIFVVAYVLNGLGQPKIALRVTLVGLAIEIVLAPLLTRALGAPGAALASALASFIMLLALARAAKREIGALFQPKSVLAATAAFGITVGVGTLIPPQPVYLLLAVPLALGHGLLLLALRELSPTELRSWFGRNAPAEPAAHRR